MAEQLLSYSLIFSNQLLSPLQNNSLRLMTVLRKNVNTTGLVSQRNSRSFFFKLNYFENIQSAQKEKRLLCNKCTERLRQQHLLVLYKRDVKQQIG